MIRLILFAVLFIASACTKDIGKVSHAGTGYPPDVAQIIITKCATRGCHTASSMEAAAGLNLENWTAMFQGSRGGPVTIPFRATQSTLFMYTNTYDGFGAPQLSPTMPLNESPLSHDEINVLWNWIQRGAPSENGEVPFASSSAKKVYISNQGCDEITVIDTKSMLPMRYVDAGLGPALEGPHMIKVAPNKKFFAVAYILGVHLVTFSTDDNRKLDHIYIGDGSWNTFVISSDSKKAYVVDWSSNGKIVEVNFETRATKTVGGFAYPHGSMLNSTDDTLYVTAQMGNFIYKIPVNDFGNTSQISLDGKFPSSIPSLDIHEIIASPDKSTYVVSCQGTNDIRVVSSRNDSVLAIIPVGKNPQELAFSTKRPYLFVSCTEDDVTFPEKRGSVYVINYQTNSVIAKIYAGHQSHGIAVDDVFDRVYVANRNVLSGGPAPHHSSTCAGRHGYVTAIDMKTLDLVPGYKIEVSVDPYGATITGD